MCFLGYAAIKAMKKDKSGEPNTRVVDVEQTPRSASVGSKVRQAPAATEPEDQLPQSGQYGDYTQRA